jgi:hypothetical protein
MDHTVVVQPDFGRQRHVRRDGAAAERLDADSRSRKLLRRESDDIDVPFMVAFARVLIFVGPVVIGLIGVVVKVLTIAVCMPVVVLNPGPAPIMLVVLPTAGQSEDARQDGDLNDIVGSHGDTSSSATVTARG